MKKVRDILSYIFAISLILGIALLIYRYIFFDSWNECFTRLGNFFVDTYNYVGWIGIVISVGVGLLLGIIYYLSTIYSDKKNKDLRENVKIGDKVTYNALGSEMSQGEIIDIKNDDIYIKIRTKRDMISKPIKKP